MSEKRVFNVTGEASGERLDKYLSGLNGDLSRSHLQRLITDGAVTLAGKAVKRSYRVQSGDKIELKIPEPVELDLKPLEIDLDILYEDEDILVVNKPPGLVVHPAPGNREKTLVNALLFYTDQLSGINGVRRPGIVHRLDKDTSGALVVAKNDLAHQQLVNQFKNRETEKIYRAIIRGNPPYNRGKVDAPIGRNPVRRKKMAVTEENSRKAVTAFEVLEQFNGYSYVEVNLETGRTHQIRVHFSYLGFPVIGDQKYGRKNRLPGVERQMLHAYRLGFSHPKSAKWLEFTAPIPADFKETLNYLKRKA